MERRSGTRTAGPAFLVQFARLSRAEPRAANAEEKDPEKHRAHADHSERRKYRSRFRCDHPFCLGLGRRDSRKRRGCFSGGRARTRSAAGRTICTRRRGGIGGTCPRLCGISSDIRGIGHHRERRGCSGAGRWRRGSNRGRVMQRKDCCDEPSEQPSADRARDSTALATRRVALAFVLRAQSLCGNRESDDRQSCKSSGSESETHRDLGECNETLQPVL